MKTRTETTHPSPRAVARLFLVLAIAAPAWAHEFYTVSPSDNLLRLVSIFTFQTLSTLPLTVTGDTVQTCHGMAFDETTGDMFVAAQLASRAAGQHTLLSINHITGQCRVVGDMGDRFTSLTFDNSSRLWALSASSATMPHALHEVDTLSGAATWRKTLAAGDGGHALAINLDDGMLYHAAGVNSRVFESIDPVTLVVTPIALSGSMNWGQPGMMYYDIEQSSFLMTSPSLLFQVYPSGLVLAFFQSIDHAASGMGGLICVSSECGDCNLDGSAPNIIDALTVAQMAVGSIQPNAGQFLCCDVDFNQQHNILDALLIAQSAVGLPASLLCHSMAGSHP